MPGTTLKDILIQWYCPPAGGAVTFSIGGRTPSLQKQIEEE
jgi:hypothetical protein